MQRLVRCFLLSFACRFLHCWPIAFAVRVVNLDTSAQPSQRVEAQPSRSVNAFNNGETYTVEVGLAGAGVKLFNQKMMQRLIAPLASSDELVRVLNADGAVGCVISEVTPGKTPANIQVGDVLLKIGMSEVGPTSNDASKKVVELWKRSAAHAHEIHAVAVTLEFLRPARSNSTCVFDPECSHPQCFRNSILQGLAGCAACEDGWSPQWSGLCGPDRFSSEISPECVGEFCKPRELDPICEALEPVVGNSCEAIQELGGGNMGNTWMVKLFLDGAEQFVIVKRGITRKTDMLASWEAKVHHHLRTLGYRHMPMPLQVARSSSLPYGYLISEYLSPAAAVTLQKLAMFWGPLGPHGDHKGAIFQPAFFARGPLSTLGDDPRTRFLVAVKRFSLVVDAVVDLWQKGVMHCDLNKGNIMLEPATVASPTQAWLIDFGLSRGVGEGSCADGGTEDQDRLTETAALLLMNMGAVVSPQTFVERAATNATVCEVCMSSAHDTTQLFEALTSSSGSRGERILRIKEAVDVILHR